MKVSGPGGPGAASGLPAARPQPAPGGFSPTAASGAGATASTSATSSLTSVGSLEALIALQEAGGPLERRRRSVKRAGRILDALEALKVGLIEGAVPPGLLEQLSRAVREHRSLTEDANLEGLLDEVETRAAVEMAKLEISQVAA
ncbi:MAG: flagellar assembly protein FliX [Caulobacterales bacterium]|jgi:hypothetical protein